MTESICGAECEYEYNNYVRQGGDDGVVVFLHGWGGDLRSFKGAFTAAGNWGVKAVNFAFPKIVPSGFGIYDYAAIVKKFLEEKKLTNVILVGHSFGGRVAIILASQKACSKLVLVDSAGMKPRFNLRKKISIARYKSRVRRGKPLDGFGSVDYNNISAEMRGVFVRIVNTHLEKLLPYIDCPTLIVWGRSDADTPPYMAKRLHRGIANSELEFINGGHYAYAQSNYVFLRLLKSFVVE